MGIVLLRVAIPIYRGGIGGVTFISYKVLFKSSDRCLEDITLCTGEEEPVILNQGDRLNLVRKRELHDCKDCPHPCI